MQNFERAIVLQYAIVAVRTVVGSTLLIAGISKFINHDKFADAVKNYQLLPERLAVLVSRWLPVIEIMIAVLLFASLLTPLVSLASALLFVAFGGAIAINLLRGRRYIDCGCFGSLGRSYLTWGMVIRNAFLAGMSVALYLSSFSKLAAISFSEMAATMLLTQILLVSWWLCSFTLRMQRLRSPD